MRRELTPDGLESAYNGKRIDLTDNCSQYGTGFKLGISARYRLNQVLRSWRWR